VKNTAFWPKTRQTQYFGKITAFDENPGFHDFRVSVIFYCPYVQVLYLVVVVVVVVVINFAV